MISQPSSATLEKGAELNSLTLSSVSSDQDPAQERREQTSYSDWDHQPAGFPRIFRKDEFNIRSKVGADFICLTIFNRSDNFVLDYKGYCTHSDKSDNSWYVNKIASFNIVHCTFTLHISLIGVVIVLVIIDLKDQNK